MIRGLISASLLVAVVLVPFGVARAQPSASPWLRAELRGAVEQRAGAQDGPAPGLDYAGWTPAVAGLEVEAFLPTLPWLGAFLGLEREGFSLVEGEDPLWSGGLWRGRVGPMARVHLGPLEVTGGVGYGLSELPWFGAPPSLTFSPLARHELLVRAQARVTLPATLEIHARAEVAALRSGAELAAEGQGLTLGGGLSVRLAELRPGVTLRGGLSYSFIRDAWTLEGQGAARQQLHRVGVGLAVHVGPPPAPAVAAPIGSSSVEPVEAPAPEVAQPVLTLQVTSRGDAATALPEAMARVGEQTVEADENGRIVLDALGAGMHSFEVSAPGHRSVSEVVELIDGQNLSLDVELVPEEAQLPATVVGQARSAATGSPLRATVSVQGIDREVRADRRGGFTLELPAGTYRLSITAPGHLGQRKRLRLRSGERAIFNVELHPERR